MGSCFVASAGNRFFDQRAVLLSDTDTPVQAPRSARDLFVLTTRPLEDVVREAKFWGRVARTCAIGCSIVGAALVIGQAVMSVHAILRRRRLRCCCCSWPSTPALPDIAWALVGCGLHLAPSADLKRSQRISSKAGH